MDPEKRRGVAAVAITMLVVPTVAILLRCFSIFIVRKKKFALDDYLAIADLPIIVAIAAITLAMVSFDKDGNLPGGLQMHTITTASSSMPEGTASGPQIGMSKMMTNMIIAIQFLYLFGLSLPRFSLVFFYHRILAISKGWFLNTLCCTGILCLLWLIVNITVNAVKCTPLQAQFAFGSFAHGRCISEPAYGVSLLATSIAIDLILLILPMPLIFNIKTTLTKRITVALVFMSGGSVIIFTLGRLILTLKDRPYGADASFEKGGATAAFIQLEAAMSLVTVSLPSIFTLIRHYYSKGLKHFASTTRSKSLHVADQKRKRVKEGHAHNTCHGSTIPLARPAAALSRSARIGTTSSWSTFAGDDLEKMALPVMPYQIMVKQEYYVRPSDFRV